MPIDRRSVLGGTALLLTGPAALADGITSNSNMTPAVVTPTGISLSQTSVSFVGTANANAFVATVIVTATGGTYSGPVTLGGSDAAKFALSNGGTYPCNLTVGAANLPAGSYSVSVTAGPVTLPPPPITVALTPPAFVPQADGVSADIYMDFVNGNYWGAAPGPSTSPPAWTFSRSGQAWGDNQAGVWTSFASGVPVITNKGLIVSVQATNLALQNRDMTQAAWVKTGMTAARSQVGIDNANNAANLLTATAANATVLQAITAASATYITSFFLKRSAGTGVVNITTDGGTTWTAQTLTPTFQRFFVTKAALTNPSIGIQIVTSGNAVIVDFAQCEASSTTIAVPTTPIFTTTAALARGIDFVSIPGLTIGTGVTLFAAATPIGGQVGNAFVLSITDGSTSNRLILERSTTNARGAVVVAATTTNMVIATAWPERARQDRGGLCGGRASNRVQWRNTGNGRGWISNRPQYHQFWPTRHRRGRALVRHINRGLDQSCVHQRGAAGADRGRNVNRHQPINDLGEFPQRSGRGQFCRARHGDGIGRRHLCRCPDAGRH